MSVGYADTLLDDSLGVGFKLITIASVALHVTVFVFGILILPRINTQRGLRLPIYTVNLVSLSTPLPPADSKIVSKKSSVKAFVPPKQKTKLLPLGKKTTAAKKKTSIKRIKKSPVKKKPAPKIDTTRDINKALSKVQRNVEKRQSANQRIDSAISRLSRRSKNAQTTASAGLVGTADKTLYDAQLSEYSVLLFNVITAHWYMPPESILRKKEGSLQAIYILRIEKSGNVRKVWFEKKSGDKYFDSSVEKAVAKSVFPPLPDSVKEPYLEVGLRFDPSGLKRIN